MLITTLLAVRNATISLLQTAIDATNLKLVSSEIKNASLLVPTLPLAADVPVASGSVTVMSGALPT